MINAVGRDIPEEILKQTGKEVFQGVHHFDGYEYVKHGAVTKCVMNSEGSKLADSIEDVLVKCMKFVLPEDLDVSGGIAGAICNPRYFRARVFANYIDTDFQC